MSLQPTLIEQALAIRPGPPPKRLVLGFSGGLDSAVLLHLLMQWRHRHPAIPILALHVNHQLQTQADAWQQHCEAICRQWDIPFAGETVSVDRSQASLEQSARIARYAAFRRHVGEGGVLILAHQRDDQVETLLLRLLRGSGPLGMGGMSLASEQDGMWILRPLLEQDRTVLEVYAREQGLDWIEDPSNSDDGFDRNFLRNQVLPLLRTRWPQLNRTLARSARLSREAALLLGELAQLDGVDYCDPGQPLPLEQLRLLPPQRALNLVRHWLKCQGAAMPSEVQLLRVLGEMLPAVADACPELIWGPHSLRRFQDSLYYVPALLEPARDPVPLQLESLQAPGLVGVLRSEPGEGVAFSRTALAAGPLTLRFRQGGESLKPAGRHTRSLKHWFQDLGVPPWWRDYWPILYCGEVIAGLPGLLLAADFVPQSPADSVWLDWQPPLTGHPVALSHIPD